MSLTQLIVGKSDTKEIEDWLITIYSPELGKESEVFRLLESKKDGTTVFTPILVDETSDNESLEPFFYSLLISDNIIIVVKKKTFLYYRDEVERLKKILERLSTLTETGNDKVFNLCSREQDTLRKVESRLVYK